MQSWDEINQEHLRLAADASGAAVGHAEALVDEYDSWRDPIAFASVDTFTLFGALGDVSGQAALDLACGPGYNTRLLAKGGAAPVVGVDFSEHVVALARQHEAAQPLGIDYHVADVAELPLFGTFDVATVVHLFNLTQSRATLRSMFRSIAANLTDTGRLLAIVSNPMPQPQPDWVPFGMRIREHVPHADAPTVKVDILVDPPWPFEYYEWQRADLAAAARAAGFRTVRWEATRTPQPDERRDAEFWRAYRESPLSSLLICGR